MTQAKIIEITVFVATSISAGFFIYSKREKQNRSACLIKQHMITTAAQSWHSMSGVNNDQPFNWEEIVGPNRPLQQKLSCPSGHEYILAPTYGDGLENGFIKCPHEGHKYTYGMSHN